MYLMKRFFVLALSALALVQAVSAQPADPKVRRTS